MVATEWTLLESSFNGDRGGGGYDWPPMAPALDLKGQLANMNRGALCGTGGNKGNGVWVGG